MRFNKPIILLHVILCSVAVLAQSGQGNPVLEKKQIIISASKGSKVPITVELARTETEKTYGLMYRDSLPENEGMLFIFDSDGYRNFWMKNTKIPLSIAYISAKGEILEIYDMKPLDVSRTYPSAHPCRYALEMNQGWFAKKGVYPGSKVTFNFR